MVTHPGLPLGPCPFSTSYLPALGPLPTGPEHLIPGTVMPPYSGESTGSSLSNRVPFLGT
jgi:hypothetical protein